MATHFIASTFLLIIFVSNCSMIKAQVVINEIYDTYGDIVQIGKSYHILPIVRRRGGGVATAPTNANQACPLSVVQKSNTSALGEPVVFYSKGKSNQNVTFSTDINVEFASAKSCGESPVWTMKHDEATSSLFVSPLYVFIVSTCHIQSEHKLIEFENY
ncbi:Trypsin inhibitor DE-3 [Bienertia sinuspersici]